MQNDELKEDSLPEDKLSEDKLPEDKKVNISVGVDTESGKVIVSFGMDISQLSLTSDQAVHMARVLTEKALSSQHVLQDLFDQREKLSKGDSVE